ncbi:MAG TPA: O-antigen ligase family protein [Anaerolineae bacterium]|nr:O-antigen ligase family protein [Anaerolineae bacterium]
MEERSTRVIDVCDNIIRWALITGAAVLPLVMSPQVYDAFDLPKATLLYIITLVVIVSYLTRSLFAGEIIIKRSPLNKPLLAFATMATVAVIVSPAPLVSVIGEYARYENLPTLYSYALLCFMATQFMAKKEWLDRLLLVSSASFALICLYGIAQALNVDILPKFMREFEGRSRSTFGNPVFFGGYIAVMLPLLLNYLLDDDNRTLISKPLISVLIIIGFAGAALSQSRGAWIAIVIGITVTVILHRKKLLRNIGTVVATGVFGMAFLLLILSIGGKEQAAHQLSSLNDRVTTATDLSGGAAASRIEIWKSSINMISVRPFAGYGPDQMYLWSPPFNTLHKAQIEKNTVADRAHNEFLQTAINSGIMGLLIFIWIISMLALMSTRLRNSSGGLHVHATGITVALLGYISQGLFGVAVIGITAPAWIFGGIIAAIYSNQKREVFSIPLRAQWKVEISMAAALAASVIAVFSLKPLVADAYYFNGIANKLASQDNQAIAAFNKAVKFNPYQSQYRRDLAIILIDQGNSLKDASLVDSGISVIDKGLQYNPDDYDLLLAKAGADRVYAAIANDMSLIGEAEGYYAKAIAKNPLSTNPRRGLLGLLMLQERYDEAIEQAKEILKVDPDDSEVRYRLGQAYVKTGRAGRARRIYKEILAKYPNQPDVKAALENLQ